MTPAFGRGTDFFIFDKNVAENGGVHVIQCFLSQEKSEQVQIKGRTARQGKKGSYQMVIPKKELEIINYSLEKDVKKLWRQIESQL